MEQTMTALHLGLEPLLPQGWLLALVLVMAATGVLAFFKNRGSLPLRALAGLVFLLALLHPVVLEETRAPVRDVAAIVVDQSFSQSFGDRQKRTQAALEGLQQRIQAFGDIDLRTVPAPLNGGLQNETKLFEALDQALADVPAQRRAGAILLTDGQVHDVPDAAAAGAYGPVHVLLTGAKDDRDRRIVLTQAPAYGIVGQTVTLKYKIVDTDNVREKSAAVTITTQSRTAQTFSVPVGEEQSLDVTIDHPGQNIVALAAAPVAGEITEANNKAALVVNGVRDRLRVLLVSGKPHAGGRTWRDLLTSDPGVDLVHFTILREPEKLDTTPQNELSLIAFPFRELFEVKLYDFDLIIFDRYQVNPILPDFYFDNIVRYVRDGGAFLEASGPSFATKDSIFQTALERILPAAPDGSVLHQSFLPRVTDIGQSHPVTRHLPRANPDDKGKPDWGPWLRQVPVRPEGGDVLMDGANGKPLLILQRVGKGRVAQIASDQIWLWARGYEGGGPHRELLRRLIHWLMKEPELDERALDVQADGDHITLRLQGFRRAAAEISMMRPGGGQEKVTLAKMPDGDLEARITAQELGVYSFETPDGERRFAIVGPVNPPELQDVVSTPRLLEPLARKSGGGILWLADTPVPDIHRVGRSGYAAGHGWIGLRQNGAYDVTGIARKPAIPAWLWLVAILGVLGLIWWREGRRK